MPFSIATDRPISQTEQLVNSQILHLTQLAECLLSKQTSPQHMLVVPFVGAGASISAGLPGSGELQRLIYDEFLANDSPTGCLASLLDEEARAHFPVKARRGICRLSLFEFCTVISRFAYGRSTIRNVVQSIMAKATHRPLVYELLSHLAKHEFVDHFVSLNFDELLDEALSDELPDRICFITSPDEVPGTRSLRNVKPNRCYLFKPFGSLSNDSYKLEPNEIIRYGSESVWHFMVETVFRPASGDKAPSICLLLIGYAAAEPAFEQLITELIDDPDRTITIYFIDTSATLPSSLDRLVTSYKQISLTHVMVDANIALEILLCIMQAKCTSNTKWNSWVPVARHQILSTLPYRDISLPARRFKIEMLLQLIKSRGFLTSDAISTINRIAKYSYNAIHIIRQMSSESLITSTNTSTTNPDKYLYQDYAIKEADMTKLTLKILETTSLKCHDVRYDWSLVESADGYTVKINELTYAQYFENKFREIVRAPDIEVTAGADPSVQWIFESPKVLKSVTKLTESTTDLFDTAFQEAEGPVTICGIWTTGEWLFHDEGWAWELFGKQMLDQMKDDRLRLSIVVALNPTAQTLRLSRGKTVLDRLGVFRGKQCCKVYGLDWSQQNRIITLVKWRKHTGKNEESGIYMRRRLGTPIVTPLRVFGKDCTVLQAIFDKYTNKAKLIIE